MRSKLWLPIALITLLTAISLGGFGVKLIRDEREVLRHQFRELHFARLRDHRDIIAEALTELAKELSQLVAQCSSEHTKNTFQYSSKQHCQSGFIRNITLAEPANSARKLYDKKSPPTLLPVRGAISAPESLGKQQRTTAQWITYFSESGVELAVSTSVSLRDRVLDLAIDISRAKVIAAIIGVLPDASEHRRMVPGTEVRLVDEHGSVLYAWGEISNTEIIERAVLPLHSPLQNFSLHYLAPRRLWDRPFYSSALFLVFPGVLLVIASLVVLTTYFYRQHVQELKETEHRLTFVNQVSHELKTPLTNIRMYAELLENKLKYDHPSAAGQLSVIVSESERLSRLISGILTFNVLSRDSRKITRSAHYVPKTIENVCRQFLPRLKLKSIELKLRMRGDFTQQLFIDADAVQQILANLISNVEKYASMGQYLGIDVCREDELLRIIVRDRGKGIPKEFQERIFDPYFRCSDAVTEGAAGAGIGLAIARDLARLHGGDIRLLTAVEGTVFEVVLHAPSELQEV